MLPFVDDFALFAKSFTAAMEPKEVTFVLLDDLGLKKEIPCKEGIIKNIGAQAGCTVL